MNPNICYTEGDTEFPHIPDLTTLQQADPDQNIFDVCCEKCGRSGSLVLIIKPEDVSW